MIDQKTITRFIIKCTLIYALLLACTIWGFGDAYARFFRAAGNQIAASYTHFGLVVELEKNMLTDKSKYDVKMVIMNKDTIDAYIAAARLTRRSGSVDVPSHNLTFNSTRQGLIPTILLLALISATPIRFRWRKAGAVFFGLILVHTYIIFKLVIWISYTCNSIDYLGFIITENLFWKEVIYYLYLTFFDDMPMRVIVPVLIWILVCFRKEDILKYEMQIKS